MNGFPNAKYAIVIGEAQSSQNYDRRRRWQEFAASVEHNAQSSADTKTIHDNVWLIPLATNMRFLGQLLEWGRMSGIVLRILFVDEEPDWVVYPKPAEETPKDAAT